MYDEIYELIAMSRDALQKTVKRRAFAPYRLPRLLLFSATPDSENGNDVALILKLLYTGT